VYKISQTAIEVYTNHKDALRGSINDQVDKRLKSALASKEDTQEAEKVSCTGNYPSVTTEDEINAYYAIKAIVREVIDVRRVTMRDALSYCSILVDGSTHKNLCRLRFGARQKTIGIQGEQKDEQQYPIESVDDIYSYAEQLKARARLFVGE
jgi:hypothetical protein